MNCKTCRNKTCLKTKKPCERIEKLLKDKGIYSADWIRPRKTGGKEYREIPFSNILYKEDLKKLNEFIGE